jgi:hypothetical protein
VTAEPGRRDRPAARDGTARAGSSSACRTEHRTPRRGELVEVAGRLADPYGQLELRSSTGGVRVLGVRTVPPALLVSAGRSVRRSRPASSRSRAGSMRRRARRPAGT